MIRIGIVDDEEAARRQISDVIGRFAAEKNLELEVRSYSSAGAYLSDKDNLFDILYLDIDMPGMSGMELAATIRQTDSSIVIIFCTNLQQFAVNGYEVAALGLLVKPIEWYPFQLYLERALKAVAARERLRGSAGKRIIVKDGAASRVVDVAKLEYVEVRKHNLLFAVRDRASGREAVLQSRGSMRDLAAELAPYGFARCSASYLVNLAFVTAVNGTDVYLGERVLPIGRTYKDMFKREFARRLATQDWEAPLP